MPRPLSPLLLWPVTAMAQSWPAHPITILMGFPAGSGVDVVARLLQEPMEKSLGGRIVTDYRTGAGGNLASEVVARAKPDGYTLLLGTAATHGVNAAIYKKLPFDVEADFTPIAPLVNVSNVLTINPQVIDVTTVREFIDTVRKNPGKYNYASTGNGTGTHLAFAELNARAGLQMVHIPYKGVPEAIQSVIAGQTCCIMNQVQTAIPHWKGGRVQLLGVTTKQSEQAWSGVPTIARSSERLRLAFLERNEIPSRFQLVLVVHLDARPVALGVLHEEVAHDAGGEPSRADLEARDVACERAMAHGRTPVEEMHAADLGMR